ncbi:MAG: transposase [Chromatiaceae bacterium]|nr:transposase [Chromatiaceae bacterium]
MTRYRRALVGGGTYFFTVVTYRRRRFLTDAEPQRWLREAIEATRADHSFDIDAWVLLPDHLHCIWTLPEGDADFATRWSLIKTRFTKKARALLQREDWMTPSKRKHREGTIWQRRFWEHVIRDQRDFVNHVNYVHYNPVKHGLVKRASDWPFSSFHRYVDAGLYSRGWGDGILGVDDLVVGE